MIKLDREQLKELLREAFVAEFGDRWEGQFSIVFTQIQTANTKAGDVPKIYCRFIHVDLRLSLTKTDISLVMFNRGTFKIRRLHVDTSRDLESAGMRGPFSECSVRVKIEHELK